jgi:splicing factor 3B subunit 1
MGCAVLPHLRNLVESIEHGIKDEEQKVRTITALALSALAEASSPYGIEAFEPVLIPLMVGVGVYRGKAFAVFLKAIGFIIPLMDSEHAGEYTTHLMPTLKREFTTNDDEMKKIVLKVIK